MALFLKRESWDPRSQKVCDSRGHMHKLLGPDPQCPRPLAVQLALMDDIRAWGAPLRLGPVLAWAAGCRPGSP